MDRRWTRILSASLFVALIAPIACGPTSSCEGDDDRRPSGFADAIAQVQPSVFHILRRRSEVNLPGGDVGQTGSEEAASRFTSEGSGIILSSSGRAITNAHVVRSSGEGAATDMVARLQNGREVAFEVVGTDPHTDLALLNLRSKGDLPSAKLGDSQAARVGDWIVTLGYPLGYSSTATAGIISGIGRTELPLEVREITYQNFIQTDASVHRGGSGGALVNSDARVIGMTTATVSQAPGLSFAIPSKVIERLLPELRTFGHVTKTWLGLFVDPVPPAVREELDLPPDKGILIKQVFDDGPAADTGIQAGDILMSLDGTPVRSVQQIAHVAGRLGLGRTIDVGIRRGLDSTEIRMTTTPHPDVTPPDNWKNRLERRDE